MRKRIIYLLVAGMFALSACSSQKKLESDDDFAVDAETSSDQAKSGGDDLSLESDSSTAASKPADKGSSDELDLDTPTQSSSEATKPPASGDQDLALESELNSLDTNKSSPPPKDNAGTDELSLDEPAQTPPAQAQQQPELQPPQELSLDDPATTAQQPPKAPEAQPPVTPPQQAPELAQNAAANQQPSVPAETPPPPVVAPVVDAQTPPSMTSGEPVTITSVQYKANSNGGTVAIGADKPVTYTTRMNSTTSQFVIEVQNAIIPKKLMRSLNTKDMASSIGSVDIYQKPGSNVARFVVQLRAGSGDPVVQQEGNSLLVIGPGMQAPGTDVAKTESATGTQTMAKVETPAAKTEATEPPPVEIPPELDSTAAAEKPTKTPEESVAKTTKSVTISEPTKPAPEEEEVPAAPIGKSGILSYENLEQFLMSNTKYYGKKISIETSGMKVTDALKFISEESGINIIFDDSVNNVGDVNIKLREVPWDQAFVLILKAKRLVYKRIGTVIRVAKLEDIKKDEDEAIAMKAARKPPESIAVKRFFIGYADLDDTKTKIETYIKALNQAALAAQNAALGQQQPVQQQPPPLGQVIVDKRNNTLIVSDTESNLKKIEELITALDMQPKQILIEAKVLTASEGFSKGLGVKWESAQAANPKPTRGSITLDPTGTGKVSPPNAAVGSVTWGQLDFLGSLTATLALGESENKIKVLSSPRITVISSTAASIVAATDLQVDAGSIINSTGQITRNVKTVKSGVTLNVTPTATNQGTVSMKMNLIKSDPNNSADGLSERTATTELFVKSGTTAVIGGIYNTLTNSQEFGTPGLRRIPVLGSLFESKLDTKSKDELIMFVTPTILKPL